MKKFCITVLMFIYIMPVTTGQPVPPPTNTLKRLLSETREDTTRVMLLAQLSVNYRFINPDSSMYFAQQTMKLASHLNFPKGKARALYTYGEANRFRGDFPQALEAQFEALEISKNIG